MNRFFLTITILVSFNSCAQFKENCVYVDPNILIINCGKEDRLKLSETIYHLNQLKAKVIVADFIFFDKRTTDSIFIKQMTLATPIILAMGDKNDSSYFKISNCYNGPHSINGNEKDNVEFLFPILKHNEKLRDSFEFLVLKYFDPEKYSRMKDYLTSFDLSKIDAKAKIEFNGNSLNCFNRIDIKDFNKKITDFFVEDKIVILGYFGTNPDIPLTKDKDKFAFKVRATNDNNQNYMYSTLISANIISNLIRKEIREEDLKKIRK